MRLKKMHWFGIVFAGITIVIAGIFYLNGEDANLFLFLVGIAFTIVALPFVAGLIIENKQEQEINEMFLEFSRNLAESVTTGTPISKSIINMRKKNYGYLSQHISKMANQIELGIPVQKAFETFANDVGSPVIRRAVALISEAEKAGGEIDYILESVAKSIAEIEKLKKERRAAIYNLVVQGYIIFFIFIGIMLVMEFQILPLAGSAGGIGKFTIEGLAATTSDQTAVVNVQELSSPFLFLLVTQGILAGLTIGKLSEGSIKAGVKHSFIMAIAAFLISSGANLFLGK